MNNEAKPTTDGDQGGEASGIVRVVKNRDYSVINNTGLRDVRLSFGARGVLAYLLTKPDNWQMQVEDLIRQSPQGEHAVRGMLRELKRFGYLKRERHAGKGGRFEWQTTIYEVPRAGDQPPPATDSSAPLPPGPPEPDAKNADEIEPSGDFPQMDNPQVEKPDVGEPQVDEPDVENRPVYKRLSNKRLREEELSERESEEESAPVREQTPAPPAPRFQKSDSVSKLQPDPNDAPELMALAREFNVNVRRPDARDVDYWADAVATMREWLGETLPEAAPCELIEAARRFKVLWRDGGRRGNPYLSQVVAHWHRLMNSDAPTGEFKGHGEPSGGAGGADRVRRAREMAYGGR